MLRYYAMDDSLEQDGPLSGGGATRARIGVTVFAGVGCMC